MSVVKRGEVAINERYRPMRFSEVIGCEIPKKTLTKFITQGNKRAKTLLLVGSSGCGKTTFGRILAMGLNCEKGDTVEPCLECASCKSIMEGQAMHVQELNMASLTGKDDAEEIVKGMYDTCLSGRNKVYLMDECHALSVSSQNFLLKAMEKPPANSYIILCTTTPQKLLQTLIKRCEKYEFKNPKKSEIGELLKGVVESEGIVLTADQKKDFFDYVQGMSYREILIALNQFASGGLDSMIEINTPGVIDYWKLCETVESGNFNKFLEATLPGNEPIDCEGFRRMMRAYLTKKLEKTGMTDFKKSLKYYDVFKIFDDGFYKDPNPLPTLKFQVFNACLLFIA